MGRPRQYDEETVLAGAMHAFRERGYAGASIKDLEQATGLTAGSIYHGYRDKAGLFAAAFAHYNQAVLGRRIAEHAPARAGLAGLRALFGSLLHEPGAGSLGCLITNSAVELGGSREPPNGVSEGLGTLEALFADRLREARGERGVAEHDDPAALGLLALYQGILVLVRAGWDKQRLEDLVNATFDRLERDLEH